MATAPALLMLQKHMYGGEYIVVKEECVGHIQKRIGRSLREYKRKMKGKTLPDNKAVGGKGRLTDVMVDRIQNYFGQAIRNNADDLENMKKSIWAIFNHIIKDDTKSMEEQHCDCPQTADTWCKFWHDKFHGSKTYDGANRLPGVFLEELKPIFMRLSDDVLLKRCLLGLTQNQNEAINGVLWANCPKTKFCGARKVELVVCETICKFNTAATSRLSILDSRR